MDTEPEADQCARRGEGVGGNDPGMVRFLDEVDALLAGKKLLPFWRDAGDRGINLPPRVHGANDTRPRPLDPRHRCRTLSGERHDHILGILGHDQPRFPGRISRLRPLVQLNERRDDFTVPSSNWRC